jgi:hypothetical protein
MNNFDRHTWHRNPALWPPSTADIFFLLAGAIAGIAAAAYAYDRSLSLPLALFVGAMVMYVVGAGPLLVLDRPHPLQHVVFVALLPVTNGAVLVAANALWENDWIALLAGIVLGGVLHRMIGRLFLPAIADEERAAVAQRQEGRERPDDEAARPQGLRRAGHV